MKKILIVFLVLAVPLLGSAQDVTRAEIEEIAKNFFHGKNELKSEVQMTITDVHHQDTTLFFIAHDNQKNFMILSNDYRVKPVLGYSDEGSYDADNIPPQLQEILSFYKQEILTIKRGKSAVKNKNADWDQLKNTDEDSYKASVAPIIKVKWNQGSGWNRFCPEDPNGPGGHVYVGCVAVSMAQSMSVFEHPDQGVGESKYVADGYGELSVNYGETEYHWDSMSTTSSDDYNALLLYHCAVSVEMGFAPDGSGAYTSDIAKALRNYFDYSSNVYSASAYDDTQAWIELLKSELDQGRPISYGGNDGTGQAGHAFNLDGYDNGDAFHVNWGWSGSYNGYFQITNLSPESSSDYSQNAKAVLGIEPKDHSPTDISLSKTKILELLPVGTVAAVITVHDPDEEDEHTLTVEGTNSIFEDAYCPFYIDGDSLKISELIAYDTYKKVYIKITAEDLDGNTFARDFTIEITKENYAPTDITITNDQFDDTVSIGTFVGKLNTIDEDEVDTFTYVFHVHENPEIGRDNDKFILSNDSLFTNYDFTDYADDECSLYIQSSDKKGETVSKEIILSINQTGTSTSAGENIAENTLKLFPNPVTDYFQVVSRTTEPVKTIKVFDINGIVKDIYPVVNNRNITIDLRNYSSGIYLVHVELLNGHQKTFKILKR
ncbi:MAG: thiol protease/hemagglutinin PrtT [Bacteroidota bacterium]|nr:thiol protease/hemagglutinin PrtT [Bacteroidota bacterium]